MKTDTRSNIYKFIKDRGKSSVKDLVSNFGISQVAIHKQLNKLLQEQKIVRVGKPPKVVYLPLEQQKSSQIANDQGKYTTVQEKINFIDHRYLYITPQGQITRGFSAFTIWWQTKNKSEKLEYLIDEYIKTVNSYEVHRDNSGWINATKKVTETFKNDCNLDEVAFVDFYSYPKFGKTKLGQLILYGKQSEQIDLINEAVEIAKPVINQIIKRYSIDTIGFIPPSLSRKIQFMHSLKVQLGLKLPEIDLRKGYRGEVMIAQKSLSSSIERIDNAKNTIYVVETPKKMKNILLIDDALGSGATLNETARKIRKISGVSGKIIGCALAGSINGFEVIKEI